MSVNPKTPVIVQGQKGPAVGQTRVVDGNLEWFDASFSIWRPAVRQNDIRDQLLYQANLVGAYRYPRGEGTGNNKTAPLPGDLNDGGDWLHRPRRLFQLDPSPNQHRREPVAVLMHGDRVVLDPFDHPIRDFGYDLPIILSSEIKGWEVENYLRRNLAIRVYDLIARCPTSYTIGNIVHHTAPTVHAVQDRATRFRERAGLLAWESRGQNNNRIRNYILSLLPAGATSTYALGGDLSSEQMAARRAANKGHSPNEQRLSSLEENEERVQRNPQILAELKPHLQKSGSESSERQGVILGAKRRNKQTGAVMGAKVQKRRNVDTRKMGPNGKKIPYNVGYIPEKWRHFLQ